MSQTAVLWILGGWFVLAAAASLVMARLMSHDSLDDAPVAIQTSAPAELPDDQLARPRMAA